MNVHTSKAQLAIEFCIFFYCAGGKASVDGAGNSSAPLGETVMVTLAPLRVALEIWMVATLSLRI